MRGAVARLNMGSVAHIRRGADLERAGKIDEASKHATTAASEKKADDAHAISAQTKAAIDAALAQ